MRKRKQGTTGKVGADPLITAVIERNRAVPLAGMARAAQIAPQTLIAIKNGKLPSEVKKSSGRRLAGLAATVTRLATYLNLNPQETLANAGFALEDRLIQDALTRTTAILHRPQLVTDTTLSAINARDGKVNVVHLDWEPFFKDNSPDCFARRYIRMVVGSIDPSWTVDDEPSSDIPEATRRLIRYPNDVDMIFGLYDTPARRALGLEFIPIPGFRVPVGAVGLKSSGIGWKTIIDPKSYSQVHAVALEAEIGYYIVAGSSGYPEGSRTLIGRHDCKEIALQFIKTVDKFRHSTTAVFFIADRFTCERVFELLQAYRSGQEARPPELANLDVPEFTLIENEPEWKPAYPVAIAIRADSGTLAKLMRQAVRVDVFQNAALRAARFYYDLLNDPSSANLDIDEREFDFLGDQSCRVFFKAYVEVVGDETKLRGLRLTEFVKDPAKPIVKLYNIAVEALKRHHTTHQTSASANSAEERQQS